MEWFHTMKIVRIQTRMEVLKNFFSNKSLPSLWRVKFLLYKDSSKFIECWISEFSDRENSRKPNISSSNLNILNSTKSYSKF